MDFDVGHRIVATDRSSNDCGRRGEVVGIEMPHINVLLNGDGAPAFFLFTSLARVRGVEQKPPKKGKS